MSAFPKVPSWRAAHTRESGTTVTRYYAPRGELHSFERGGSTYQVHADALGSVRAITDSNGSVVAHYEYEAWGGLLATSSDLSGGFAYRFVGALGVRFDGTTGLYYCRQRWLDPGLARFISRDIDHLASPDQIYTYSRNQPKMLVDYSGRAPASPAWSFSSNLVASGSGLVYMSLCATHAFNSAVKWGKDQHDNADWHNPVRKWVWPDRIQHCIASCIFNKCMMMAYPIYAVPLSLGT